MYAYLNLVQFTPPARPNRHAD
eukprot:SAG31_NODE_23564_length_501_cov_1.995025_1_plen_21_part_10